MGEIVVATMGTWGDLFPALGLATGLVAAGHTVAVAASPSYRDLVEGEGLRFRPIGSPLGFVEYAAEPKIFSGRMGGFAGFAHLFRTFIFPQLDRYVADLIDAISGADLLLAHPALIAAPIAADFAGVRWGTFSVFPGLIPTAYALPVPTSVPSPPGSLGRSLHRLGWSAARVNVRRVFDEPVNRARSHVGLAKVKDAFFAPVDSGGPYLILASPAVVDRQPDWPAQVQLTGFVTWDRMSTWQERDGMRDFLAEGDPPILVTLGASSSLDPGDFYQRAADAVVGLGHRALILTGPAPVPPVLRSEPRMFVTAYAPLSLVARSCRAAVHHGGVGTTVELLQAGLPQLVVPRGFDQPQTASRLTRLGVAHSVPWRRSGTRRLQRSLGALLADGRVRANAVSLQGRLAQEDGLAQAVAAIGAELT